jgi:hypothetical protein
MKFIVIFFSWLMIPPAFIAVAFDIAKAAVESKILDKFREQQ